jgi:hypothetical protein
MQGLGKNAGANTLFYGSVHDSTTHRTLETKLKKAYWETKQTFIQKLGKDQDEHVVASDSDIDLRLEVLLLPTYIATFICHYAVENHYTGDTKYSSIHQKLTITRYTFIKNID